MSEIGRVLWNDNNAENYLIEKRERDEIRVQYEVKPYKNYMWWKARGLRDNEKETLPKSKASWTILLHCSHGNDIILWIVSLQSHLNVMKKTVYCEIVLRQHFFVKKHTAWLV